MVISKEEERQRELETLKAIQERAAAKLPQGVPGKFMREFAGRISHEDCELMKAAIEEAFEQVDPDEW